MVEVTYSQYVTHANTVFSKFYNWRKWFKDKGSRSRNTLSHRSYPHTIRSWGSHRVDVGGRASRMTVTRAMAREENPAGAIVSACVAGEVLGHDGEALGSSLPQTGEPVAVTLPDAAEPRDAHGEAGEGAEPPRPEDCDLTLTVAHGEERGALSASASAPTPKDSDGYVMSALGGERGLGAHINAAPDAPDAGTVIVCPAAELPQAGSGDRLGRKHEHRPYVPEDEPEAYKHRLRSLALDLEALEQVQQKSSPELQWDDHDTSVTIHSAVNLLKNQVSVLEYNKKMAEAAAPPKGIKAKLLAAGDRVQRLVVGSPPADEPAPLDVSAHSQLGEHRHVRICPPEMQVSMDQQPDYEMHMFARCTGEPDDPTPPERRTTGAIQPYQRRAVKAEESEDSIFGAITIIGDPCGGGCGKSSTATTIRAACCAACATGCWFLVECLGGGD